MYTKSLRRLDYIEYFARQLGLMKLEVQKLLQAPQVEAIISQFMRSAYPLGVCVIYLGRRLEKSAILRPPYDFHRIPLTSFAKPDSAFKPSYEYSKFTGQLIRQLARILNSDTPHESYSKSEIQPQIEGKSINPFSKSLQFETWMSLNDVGYYGADSQANWGSLDVADRLDYLKSYWLFAFADCYENILMNRDFISRVKALLARDISEHDQNDIPSLLLKEFCFDLPLLDDTNSVLLLNHTVSQIVAGLIETTEVSGVF